MITSWPIITDILRRNKQYYERKFGTKIEQCKRCGIRSYGQYLYYYKIDNNYYCDECLANKLSEEFYED